MIEVDEFDHSDINIEYEIQRQKAIEKELDCEFIRVNPDEQNFDVFKGINKIHRHVKESSKKSLIGNLSKILSKIKFKSDNSIKSKALKYVNKEIFPSL